MNDERWLFIGKDERLLRCRKAMQQLGHVCDIVQTDRYSDSLERVLIDWKPAHIVLPILELEGTFPPAVLEAHTQLYTGVVSEAWLKPFKDAGITTHSYLKEELFIWENARLTAEAFIKIFYLETSQPILNQYFQVAGYGRIGKAVADLLRALGGKVTVLARSGAQLGEAAARGFETSQLTSFVHQTPHYIVNTIPAKWLTKANVAPLHIFDLASAPGCLIDDQVPEYYTILPGLPGKHFPAAAATALQGALQRIYRR